MLFVSLHAFGVKAHYNIHFLLYKHNKYFMNKKERNAKRVFEKLILRILTYPLKKIIGWDLINLNKTDRKKLKYLKAKHIQDRIK